jgi:DNA-binding transcriptional ArsR family regulator
MPMPEPEQDLPPLDGITVLKLLGNPARLRLLLLLDGRGEAAVGDLARDLGVSQPAVSHDLALLLRARLVRCRRDGQRTFYRLASPAVTEVLRASCRLCGPPAAPR